jgi:hypothetical protein
MTHTARRDGRTGQAGIFKFQHCHQVVIMRARDGSQDEPEMPSEIIAEATVDASVAAESDGFNYADLDRPVVLLPGQTYFIGSSENVNAVGAQDAFPEGGSYTPAFNMSGSPYGTGFTLDATNLWRIKDNGEWEAKTYFTPLVNIKIQ